MKYTLFCLMFFLFPILSFSNIYDNLVLVSTRCVYEVENKNTGVKQTILDFPEGTGYFVTHEKTGQKNLNAEYIITAGHNVSCEPDPESFNFFSVISVRRSEIYILFKNVSYPAEVTRENFDMNDGKEDGFLHKKDDALLKILMPANITHGHFFISEKYKIGKIVWVAGFSNIGGFPPRQQIAWIPVYRMGIITEITENLIRFDLQAHNGMSGSPLFWERRSIFPPWRKKQYVAGIVISNTSNINGIFLNSALATRLSRDFLKK